MVRRATADEPKLRALVGRGQPSIGTPEIIPTVLADQLAAAVSWIALPLRTHNRKVGALVLAASGPGVDLDEQIEVAGVLAAQGMAAYDKAILFTQVQELAVVDELTGIANRRRFFESAARDFTAARRHGQELTALMVDIDHFKQVNDLYGHASGDDVIRGVAERLNAQMRTTDLLGRYGGEEFAFLVQGASPADDLPERLRAAIAAEAFATRSGPLGITISIGMAYLTPADADVAALLARADRALYRAKHEGRNCVRAA
jgi:diguanylate cyclase (GGDEF)-like protein